MADTELELPVGVTEEQIDLLMRAIFDSRSMSRDPISDERWAERLAGPFQTTNQIIREEAIRMYVEGEMDD